MDFAQRFERVLSGEVQGDIVCGDCLDVMAQMPDGCVDVVITDPDYGVGIDYSGTITSKKTRRKTFEELQADLAPALLECRRLRNATFVSFGLVAGGGSGISGILLRLPSCT